MAANNLMGVRLDPAMEKRLREEAEKNRRTTGAELSVMIAEALAWRQQREAALAKAGLDAAPRLATGLPKRKAR
jgi:predicted transcriptional regulator